MKFYDRLNKKTNIHKSLEIIKREMLSIEE